MSTQERWFAIVGLVVAGALLLALGAVMELRLLFSMSALALWGVGIALVVRRGRGG